MPDKKETKILIIEDEKNLIELLKAKLEKEGYNVKTAYNGEDGLKKIESEKPNLILLDIVMPKLDGYEVLEKLNEINNETPVIIISNSGQPVEIEKTRKLGAVDHLIKTQFSPDEVLEKVKKYIEKESGETKDDGQNIPKPMIDKSVQQSGVKVLLVEDDAFLREICSKKLVNSGYEVFTAIDGDDALKIIYQIKPDIILLDIILPSIDGFQILSQVRSNTDGEISGVPIIMLSNLGQEDDIKKAMAMGANDYLVKAHFTTEEIIAKIKQIIDKK